MGLGWGLKKRWGGEVVWWWWWWWWRSGGNGKDWLGLVMEGEGMRMLGGGGRRNGEAGNRGGFWDVFFPFLSSVDELFDSEDEGIFPA